MVFCRKWVKSWVNVCWWYSVAMSRTQTRESCKAFCGWGSKEWQSLPLTHVQTLTVCAENAHCSFLLWHLLLTASLQTLCLQTLDTAVYYKAHSLCQSCIIITLPCSIVCNMRSELPGCCGFSIIEPRHQFKVFSVSMCVISVCHFFAPSLGQFSQFLEPCRMRLCSISATDQD